MTVLVTGSTGFVGSHVTRLLLDRGLNVCAFVRPGSDLWRLQGITGDMELVECDLRDFDGIDRHLDRIRPQVCIHLAWDMEPGAYLNSLKNVAMVGASLHLASKLASLECEKFMAAGTCFEYSIDGADGECLSENSPTEADSLYAGSKLACRMVLERISAVTGMPFIWSRFFFLYGPFEDRRRLVPYVIESLLKGDMAKTTQGEQIRDYLHVEDAASALLSVMKSDLSGTVNIGSGKPVRINEIVEKIGVLLDRSHLIHAGAVPYGRGEPMFVCSNNEKLKSGTDWKACFDLEQGLRETIGWWKHRS